VVDPKKRLSLPHPLSPSARSKQMPERPLRGVRPCQGRRGPIPAASSWRTLSRSLARRRIAVRGTCDFSWISRLAKDQQQQQPQALPNTDHGKAA